MTVQEIESIKQEYGLSDQALSQLSGIPVKTIQEILSGAMESPPDNIILALERVLCDRMTERPFATSLRETAYSYAVDTKGKMTLEDYYALPDDQGVELIDGKFYDMAAPSIDHQIILAHLAAQFVACAESHDGECEVLFAPCDVQLDRDNKTMLQPDLLIVCNDELLRNKRCVYGAPDLVLEILSPSTRSNDMVLKLDKYRNAGVREYWIVDPENREVLVYYFKVNDNRPEIYSFDEVIPIHISGEKCHINFSRIRKKLLD